MEKGSRSVGSAVAPASPIASDSPLAPDSVLALPGGAVLVLEQAQGLPAAGIRISAPLDPPWPDAARVLIAQALNRAHPQAEAIGASIEGGMQDGRLYYQVVGDLRDIDELTWIARRMVRSPEPDPAGATVRARKWAERLAETPQGRLAQAVRRRSGLGASATDHPASGADAARRLWLRSHARDRLRVFVLGDVPVPWVLADLSRVGAPRDSSGADPSAPDPPSVLAQAPSASEQSSFAVQTSPPAAQVGSVYAWKAAAFKLGPPGDPVALAAFDALRAGLATLSTPGAELRLHRNPGGAPGWAAVTARARRDRAASVALDAAMALLTEEGIDAWWVQGATRARMDLLETAATPGGWLALADRYFAGPSPSVGPSPPDRAARGSQHVERPMAAAWPAGALGQLRSLRRSDFAPVLERVRATLFHPRVGP